MAKRIAFIGDVGAVYEAVPYGSTYPTGAITITEDVAGQAGDLARYVKSDVADDFSEKGICQIYKDGAFSRYLIFDHLAFYQWQAQGGYDVYVWKKVALADSESEQTLTTGSGELAIGNLDSGQAALPTFAGTVMATIGTAYQDRGAYISTPAAAAVGVVTFGVTLSAAGASGTPYFDIIVIQF